MADLSPQAQAVLDAVCDNTEPDCDTQHLIAAALRAAAEHVGPSEILPPGYAYSAPAEEWHYQFKLEAKRQLLVIATELENHQ